MRRQVVMMFVRDHWPVVGGVLFQPMLRYSLLLTCTNGCQVSRLLLSQLLSVHLSIIIATQTFKGEHSTNTVIVKQTMAHVLADVST